MTTRYLGVLVLTGAGVAASSAGALILWGLGAGLLVLGLLMVLIAVKLGEE